MKIRLLAVVLFFFPILQAPILQAQDVAPPPKPADSGPSLVDTMQFIQDKLNEAGKVNAIEYYHDGVTGEDGTDKVSIEASNFRANAGTCRIDYHTRASRNGKETVNADAWFSMRAVQDVEVLPVEQEQKRIDSATGHPEYSSRFDPAISVLRVRLPGNSLYTLWFFDESMANRVAKALVHAVELCGGGNKDPF